MILTSFSKLNLSLTTTFLMSLSTNTKKEKIQMCVSRRKLHTKAQNHASRLNKLAKLSTESAVLNLKCGAVGSARTTKACRRVSILGRVLRKTWTTVLATCLASCSALTDGCRGTVHAQYYHDSHQCSIHCESSREAHSTSKRRWAPQTRSRHSEKSTKKRVYRNWANCKANKTALLFRQPSEKSAGLFLLSYFCDD